MKPARDQSDWPIDVPTANEKGYSRNTNKFAGNQHAKTNSDAMINKGRGPTKGNQDHRVTGGPSATKDAYRAAPHTSGASGREYPKNIDSMNYGKQERTPGGTRAWDPKAGQNYNGNADSINVSGYSMGDGKVTKGSRPSTAAGQSDFNFGPKSQY
jgi:hypothetical protein